MSETNGKTLADIAWGAYHKHAGTLYDSWQAAAVAVAAHVRAEDAARGGALSAEQIATACRGRVELVEHMAAQGRRIASLEEQNDEARRLLATRIEASRLDEARAELAKARERIAEMAAMSNLDEERIETAKKNRGEALMRAKAAESALATLRQAAREALIAMRSVHDEDVPPGFDDAQGDLAKALSATPAPEHPDTATHETPTRKAWKEGEVYGWTQAVACASGEDYARPATASMPPGVLEKAEALATDTATLRAIRDWAECRVSFVSEDYTTGQADAKRSVLGLMADSGQARDGDHFSGLCRWCGTAAASGHGDHCPDKPRPTGHPNAGDSPAEDLRDCDPRTVHEVARDAEDWRTVENFLSSFAGRDDAEEARAALARLRSRNLP